MDIKEIREIYLEPFTPPDLAGSWTIITNVYAECGFPLPLTINGKRMDDDAIIAEITWVHQQYRKYIGRIRGTLNVENKVNIDVALEYIKECIDKNNEVPDSRKMLVYQVMKTQWLNQTWNHLAWLKENTVNDGEDMDE